MSKAIVLVAFGSANLDGINNSINLLENELNDKFGGDYTVVKAFTSNRIIELLKERHDYVVPHLSKALFNLINHGYEDIIIQPLHIMSAKDNNKINEIAEEYKYSLRKLVIRKPLFHDLEDGIKEECKQVAEIICEDIGNGDILLVGHGSKNNSNELYDHIENAVEEVSGKKVYLATLEGKKTIEKAIEEMKRNNVTRLMLKVLFVIPGKHVLNDITVGKNSWVSKLNNAGIEVEISKKSLLQYEKIRKIYVEAINEEIE